MKPSEAARFIGRPVDELVTPCLVIDEEALAENLSRMAGYFAGRPSRLRPHFKSHKCVTLARRQLAAGGAVGITCAKVSEAEQLVAGGITEVLIANQVVGEAKAERLAALNLRATVRSAVDSAGNVAELARAARRIGVTIPLLVEVDVGMGRCGVPPGAPALELARLVAETQGVRFDGLQGYEGHLVMLADAAERRRRVAADLAPLVETRRLIERSGLEVAIVSSGGTGTYDVTGEIAGIDEVQCGSYALMDAHYARIRPEFRVACRVLTTVISAARDRVVLDVGVKGLGLEFGPPAVEGHPGAEVRRVSEEHTAVASLEAEVGRRVWVVPTHGCTTANLYRRFWVVREGRVVDVWPIEGSGCLE